MFPKEGLEDERKQCSVNQYCAELREKGRGKEATLDFVSEHRAFCCLKRDDPDAAMGGVESSRQELYRNVVAIGVDVERVNVL